MKPNNLVTARTVLRVLRHMQSLGRTRSLQLLEHREPELAECVLEELTAINGQIHALGGPTPESQRTYCRVQQLVLVAIECMRVGHAESSQRPARRSGRRRH